MQNLSLFILSTVPFATLDSVQAVKFAPKKSHLLENLCMVKQTIHIDLEPETFIDHTSLHISGFVSTS